MAHNSLSIRNFMHFLPLRQTSRCRVRRCALLLIAVASLSSALGQTTQTVTITTTNATVKTGSKGGTATSGNTFIMDYQLTSNLSQDPPGTYTLAIVYTLTAP